MNIIKTLYRHREENSVISSLQSVYPVRLVQIKRCNDQTAHIMLLGFGGGLLWRDTASIDVTVGARSTLCLCTPGTSKIFKTANGNVDTLGTHQILNCLLEEHATLVFIPDPTCMYQSSKLIQSQKYRLTDTSSLVLVDWYSSGRQGRDDFWSLHSLRSTIEIYRGGMCVFGEDLFLTSTEFGSVASKVGGYSVFGIILILGGRTEQLRHRADVLRQRQSYSSHRQSLLSSSLRQPHSTHSAHHPLVSVSSFQESHMSVIRLATADIETAYQLAAALLSPIETIIGYIPYVDRFAAGADSRGPQSILNSLRLYDRREITL